MSSDVPGAVSYSIVHVVNTQEKVQAMFAGSPAGYAFPEIQRRRL